MRLWVGVILQTITRGKPSEKNPVLFLLDEAAHLGKIQALETAVTLMRGMGVRLWFFFQSLNQLHECYGEKAKTILENIDTRQYFGTNGYETAEAVSKEIGDATIAVTSRGENSGWSSNTGGTGPQTGSKSGGTSSNVSETGRRLYRPEEVLTLPDRFALVFHRNLPVVPAWIVRYYDHPAFRDGGAGRQSGLGRKAGEMALWLLLASVAFALLVGSLFSS